MRILFISHSSGYFGGAENNLLKIMKGASKHGFECHCLFPKEGPLKESAALLGIKTYISDIKWWVKAEAPIITFSEFCNGLQSRVRKIVLLIKDHKIDLVVTNTITISEGAIAARLSGIPHVWRIAELLSTDPSLVAPLSLSELYSIILSLSNKVLVVANAVKEEIENYTGQSSKIEVVYAGIEIEEKTYNPHYFKKTPEKIILSAGNICKRKGFLTLLKSARYVKEAEPTAKFMIAGRITEHDYYKCLLKERQKLGLQNTFKFIGFQNNIRQLLRDSSVFVLPSISEPFGTVLLEAMSAGKPIVATKSGGVPEAIIDGSNGFLVPIEDPKTMADKIIFLLKNKEVASKMGEDGLNRCKKNYDINEFTDKCNAIFQSTDYDKSNENIDPDFIKCFLQLAEGIKIDAKNIREVFHFYHRVRMSRLFKFYNQLGKAKFFIRNIFGIE